MMLVDIPSDQVGTGGEIRTNIHHLNRNYVNPKKYLRPNTLYNVGTELDYLLNRTDIDDHEKWLLYNQSLRKFFFILNEAREKNFGSKPVSLKTEAVKKETTNGQIPTQSTHTHSTHTSPLNSHMNLQSSSQSTFIPSEIRLPTTTLPQTYENDDDDISLNSDDGALGFTPYETENLPHEYMDTDNVKTKKFRNVFDDTDAPPIKKRELTKKFKSGKDIQILLPALAKWTSEQKVKRAQNKQRSIQRIYNNILTRNDPTMEVDEIPSKISHLLTPTRLRHSTLERIKKNTPLKRLARTRKSSQRTPIHTHPYKVRAVVNERAEGTISRWETKKGKK